MANFSKVTKRFTCAAFIGIAVFLYALAAAVPQTIFVEKGFLPEIASRPYLSINPTNSGIAAVSAGENSYTARVNVFGVLPLKTIQVRQTQRTTVLVSGCAFGIKMFQDGAMVIGFSDIYTSTGSCNPAKEAGIAIGDIIVEIDKVRITANEQVAQSLNSAAGQAVTVVYKRAGVAYTTTITAVVDKTTGTYRCGMWVRDSSAGIGTMTFTDPSTGVFAGLGHSINDIDTGLIVPFLSGEIVGVEVLGITPSKVGSPGEIKGRFANGEAVGIIKANNAGGVYGVLYTQPTGMPMDIAFAHEIEIGPATIYTTLGPGGPAWYSVQIERVNLNESDNAKDMLIRITDPDLLNLTGGIVQGMSGSPIVQNGRLVGAVTHVLVNDPTRGYGIFAENMLEIANNIVLEKENAA